MLSSLFLEEIEISIGMYVLHMFYFTPVKINFLLYPADTSRYTDIVSRSVQGDVCAENQMFGVI